MEVGILASTDIFEHFEELPDPRMDRQKRHCLMDILFVAICAVICGATSFVDMHDFGCAKEGWLRKHLELPNGIPSHDTFRRVFSLIDADSFRRCFMNWTRAMSEATGGDIIAFDGKTLRRSFDNATGMGAIHVVNAWSCENDFCIGQMKVDCKSNEITAMPALMALMDIRGSVVTADALNCQKEIADQIIEQGGDYVLAVKGNQPSLHEDVRLFFEDSLSEGFEVAHRSCESDDWGHGRVENRKCWVVSVDQLQWFKHAKDWRGLKTIACAQSTRRTRDTESVENRYYISSLDDVTTIAQSIRHHWKVENKLHWVMDVDFDEDHCRVRTDHGGENFALLRQMAHNLLKQESSKGVSVRRKMKKAGWDEDFLIGILVGV
jgi:predicted transposase YbfD/YdcC